MQVMVDGTNSNTALIALGYVSTIAARFAQDYGTDLAERTRGGSGMQQVSVTLEQRPWFNPDLNGRWFFVPGVIATLTLVMIVNLTAFAIVREREVGTLEQIMVSPIRPAEFILGKTVPFFLDRARRGRRWSPSSACSGSRCRSSAIRWSCCSAHRSFC